jgi:uncharacterized protein (TIGR00725 family)
MLPSQNNDTPRVELGIDPASGHPIRFGVMGSASNDHDDDLLQRCHEIGRAVATCGGCLLTGACPGLPQAAALGAKESGGHTIGISPAINLKQHVDVFDSPFQEYDVLIYTGLGLMGRELINIRSSDIIIIVGGRSGTLGEFAIAFEEGKLIGVLEDSGGIAAVLPSIEATFSKSTGAEVLYESDPDCLVGRLLTRYRSESYSCPCQPSPDSLDSMRRKSPCPCNSPEKLE